MNIPIIELKTQYLLDPMEFKRTIDEASQDDSQPPRSGIQCSIGNLYPRLLTKAGEIRVLLQKKTNSSEELQPFTFCRYPSIKPILLSRRSFTTTKSGFKVDYCITDSRLSHSEEADIQLKTKRFLPASH